MAIELYLAENDGLVSEDQTSPLALSLFADQNQEKEVRLYTEVDYGYQVSNLQIAPLGLSANKWALAPDNAGAVGTYGADGSPLVLGTVEDRVYFWAKVKATDDESPVTDTSVSMYLSGVEEQISPIITDPSLTYTHTDSTYTVNFNPVQGETGLEYFLVEGTIEELSDPILIQQLAISGQGTDVSQLSGSGSSGEGKDINVYVKDPAGNVSLYTPTFILILYPQTQSINTAITRVSDGQVVTSIDGNAYDKYLISWQVYTQDSSNEDVIISSGDESIVTLSQIDYVAETAIATLQPVESGSPNEAFVNIITDLDGFTKSINTRVSTLEDVPDSQSIPNTFNVVL